MVLQFIGDEIYAVFGAPLSLSDHAIRAYRAGLEMNRRLEKLNNDLGEKAWPILQHGIGIHTGEALAANIGSPDRLSYLLVGDTVNLASRLEGHTKTVQAPILMNETTYKLAQEQLPHLPVKHLPDLQLKGKLNQVEVYAILPTT